MTRHLRPETFGEHAAAWNDDFFAVRVATETDPERLRAAQRHEHERDGETRTERIGMINKRLAKLDA